MKGADDMPPFRVDVVTLIPEVWPVLLSAATGLVGKAFERGEVELSVHDLRQWGKGVHRKVDDLPFGGGAGMVLGIEPLHAAIEQVRQRQKGPVFLLSPAGKPWEQLQASSVAAGPGIAVICGRYEGVDARVEHYVDGEVSLGDYVLSAGDPAAWAIIDSVVRLLPGVLGNPLSAEEESFGESKRLEYPQYTRPPLYDGHEVPAVLRSGDHEAIAAWRREQSAARTALRRPDLAKES